MMQLICVKVVITTLIARGRICYRDLGKIETQYIVSLHQ